MLRELQLLKKVSRPTAEGLAELQSTVFLTLLICEDNETFNKLLSEDFDSANFEKTMQVRLMESGRYSALEYF